MTILLSYPLCAAVFCIEIQKTLCAQPSVSRNDFGTTVIIHLIRLSVNSFDLVRLPPTSFLWQVASFATYKHKKMSTSFVTFAKFVLIFFEGLLHLNLL